MRCFGDVKDTIDSKQLKNQIYLLRFGHTRALLFKKKGHKMAISPVLGKLTHMWIRWSVIFGDTRDVISWPCLSLCPID